MLPFSQLNSLTAGFLQCAGDMVTPSVLNAVMCGLDVVCNALLIPHFGVLGAGDGHGAGLRAGESGDGLVLLRAQCAAAAAARRGACVPGRIS